MIDVRNLVATQIYKIEIQVIERIIVIFWPNVYCLWKINRTWPDQYVSNSSSNLFYFEYTSIAYRCRDNMYGYLGKKYM
jgi:hypothetical protein